MKERTKILKGDEKQLIASTVKACLEIIKDISDKYGSSHKDKLDLHNNILTNLYGCGILAVSKEDPKSYAFNAMEAISNISSWFNQNINEKDHEENSCEHCDSE